MPGPTKQENSEENKTPSDVSATESYLKKGNGSNRLHLNAVHFQSAAHLQNSDILNTFDAKNHPYTAWLDPGIRMVIFVSKKSGDVTAVPAENCKDLWFARK